MATKQLSMTVVSLPDQPVQRVSIDREEVPQHPTLWWVAHSIAYQPHALEHFESEAVARRYYCDLVASLLAT